MKRLCILSFSFLSLFSQSVIAWDVSSLEKEGISRPKFQKLLDFVFEEKANYKTDSLILIKNNKLVYEQYARGYSVSTKHIMWSMTKSLVGILYGAAVKDKIVRLDEPASLSLPRLDKKITIRDLLQMSSGLKWDESYRTDPITSDVVKMLYSKDVKDMGSYAASLGQEFSSGESFKYSSGTSNILTKILQKKLSDKEYFNYPWEKIFGPLDIKSAVWEKDRSGNFVGSSYCYMTPRDIAKLGQLMLNEGLWKGERVIPSSWVSFSKEVVPALLKKRLSGKMKNESYGAHWWLNRRLPGREKVMRDGPEDIFYARGFHGQFLFIIPSLKIVLLRMGFDTKDKISRNMMIKYLMESLQ